MAVFSCWCCDVALSAQRSGYKQYLRKKRVTELCSRANLCYPYLTWLLGVDVPGSDVLRMERLGMAAAATAAATQDGFFRRNTNTFYATVQGAWLFLCSGHGGSANLCLLAVTLAPLSAATSLAYGTASDEPSLPYNPLSLALLHLSNLYCGQCCAPSPSPSL